jgi:hypothetical protein
MARRDHIVEDWGDEKTPFKFVAMQPVEHQPGKSWIADHLWEKTGRHVGFYGWLRAVNDRIEDKILLGVLDLQQRSWRDEYNARLPPSDAADLAIEKTADEFRSDPP